MATTDVDTTREAHMEDEFVYSEDDWIDADDYWDEPPPGRADPTKMVDLSVTYWDTPWHCFTYDSERNMTQHTCTIGEFPLEELKRLRDGCLRSAEAWRELSPYSPYARGPEQRAELLRKAIRDYSSEDNPSPHSQNLTLFDPAQAGVCSNCGTRVVDYRKEVECEE